jgi:chromosomal replication initiation ATPase DnaA
MKQTLFNLEPEHNYLTNDYIVSLCNVEAYKAIQGDVAWPNNQLLIIGDESSGKTHLTKIWQERVNGKILTDNENFSQYANRYSAYILEDIESLKTEEYLFHLINFARNNSFSLLLTSQILPNFLLADLRSRINAMHKILIRKPDDEMLRILLLKQFSDRQLRITPEVIDYIISRAERSFEFIAKLVTLIDQMSLIEKKNITIPMVKKVLSTAMFLEGELVANG